MGGVGTLMSRLGEFERAHELTEESYRLCRSVGDVFASANWNNNLGWHALLAGDTAGARARFDESLELSRLIDDLRGTGTATVNLGWVELVEGDFERAFTRFDEASSVARRLGRRTISAEALWGFAQMAAASGDTDRAGHLAGAAATIGRAAGFDPAVAIPFARHLDEARAALGDPAWQKAWAEGAELDLAAALRLALEP
jgi:tetratricopeptide (TPR) repeat protein